MILSAFNCPLHGLFDAMADSHDDEAPCPVELDNVRMLDDGTLIAPSGPRVQCGEPSPWSPSAPAVHTAFVVTATRGPWQPPPSPTATDTRPLMEGQSMRDWKRDRQKMWREHDRKVRRERG